MSLATEECLESPRRAKGKVVCMVALTGLPSRVPWSEEALLQDIRPRNRD